MDRRRFLLVVAVVVALLGAGLVFVYAQNAEDRAAGTEQTEQVLVATQTIARGESMESAFDSGKITRRFVPAPALDGTTNDTADLADKYALTTVYANEQLVLGRFGPLEGVEVAPPLDLPANTEAVLLNLDDESRVGSFTQPGSKVKVYVSSPDLTVDDGEVPEAQALLNSVLVVAVGTTTLDQEPGVDVNGNPLPAIPTTAVTLALTARQSAQVIGARRAGYSLTFTLLAPPERQASDDESTESGE